MRSQTSGSASIMAYFDELEQEIRNETMNLDGRAVFVDTKYNQLIQVARVSDPYFSVAERDWNISAYDICSRLIKVTQPSNRVTTTNPQSQTATQVVNSQGQTDYLFQRIIGKNYTLIVTLSIKDNAFLHGII